MFLSALLALPFAARAVDHVDFSVKLEPGLALSLSSPQTDRFGLGAAATLKALVGVGGYLSMTGGVTFLGLPAKGGFPDTSMGTAWAPSLGIRFQVPRESEAMRLQKPHEAESFKGGKPWIDADVMYVRTGPLDRVGFAAAVGISFPIGEARSFWLGPFVRYMQILDATKAGFNTGDATTLILGVSLETGTRLVRDAVVEKPAPAPAVVAVVEPVAAPPPVARSDRDGDGVFDDVDACPDMKGPASNNGCPVYEKVIVRPDKLELKDKIQFSVGDSRIEPVSYPALDETAKALVDNPGFRVAIDGHASSEGGDERNQDLSNQRAAAVLEYLANHGVARDRLVSKGFSSSRPTESNTTQAGREANRRVEFVVHFIILKEGSPQ